LAEAILLLEVDHFLLVKLKKQLVERTNFFHNCFCHNKRSSLCAVNNDIYRSNCNGETVEGVDAYKNIAISSNVDLQIASIIK
jgi:hypothetical protein